MEQELLKINDTKLLCWMSYKKANFSQKLQVLIYININKHISSQTIFYSTMYNFNGLNSIFVIGVQVICNCLPNKFRLQLFPVILID